MIKLTDVKRLARKQTERTQRRASNRHIAQYNTVSAMRCNPYSGDTTILPRDYDGKTDHGEQTEDDIINSLLYSESRSHVKRSLERLMPELISNEVKEYWQQKIGQSSIKAAKALKPAENPHKQIFSTFIHDRSMRDLYEWMEL